jgi:DNA uptake protein ComE-like DNA-binding protein
MNSKEPFFVSQSNKRALLFFLIIAFVVVFFPRFSLWISSERNFKVKSQEINALSSARKRYESKFRFQNFSKKRGKIYYPPQRMFDPNTYSQSDWEVLGLTPKQAAVVVRFCSRGIYSNDQLQRIFVIPDKLYELIKDSTIYPKRVLYAKVHSVSKGDVDEKLVLIDVNRASEEELEKIPGIGPFFAKNILRCRTKLGGFVRKEQLLEVWKIDSMKLSEIERFIYVDPKATEKFNINEVSAEVLRKHPYFNWNVSNSIVKLRIQKKSFSSIEDIKESVLIDDELFEKIKPYLTLQNDVRR